MSIRMKGTNDFARFPRRKDQVSAPHILQKKNTQGRQCQRKGMILPMGSNRGGLRTSKISMTASTVVFGIAVQGLSPDAASWDAYPIIPSWHRSKVADGENQILRAFPFPQKTDGASFPIVKVNPLKPFGSEIQFVHGRLCSIKAIEVP